MSQWLNHAFLEIPGSWVAGLIASRRPNWAYALGVCCAVVLGCGTPASVPGPESALVAYTAAVRSSNADAIYRLLDPATQATTSPERIAELIEQNRSELDEQLSVLDQAAREGVDGRAEIALANRDQVVLYLEGGKWMVAGGILDAPALRTPRDAILALRNALKRRSLRGLLRVLARVPRSEIEAEIELFLSESEDTLDLETEIQGNIARIRLSSGRSVLLTREAGEWRVVDVE